MKTFSSVRPLCRSLADVSVNQQINGTASGLTNNCPSSGPSSFAAISGNYNEEKRWTSTGRCRWGTPFEEPEQLWSETSIDAAASDRGKTDHIVHAMITETGK
jgi:hypothetical protein